MATNHLSIQNIYCVRGENLIFKELSFELKSGDFLLIEGGNGSGKSTLLKYIAGFTSPNIGKIFWNNIEIKKNKTYSTQFHYVGHTNGLKLNLTVTENIKLLEQLFLLNHDSKDINIYLELLKLKEHQNKLVKHLSAGQKKRLSLLKLLKFPKPLWILDEPLTTLDAESQQFFLESFGEHCQQGGITIVTSHQTLPKKYFNQVLRLEDV